MAKYQAHTLNLKKKKKTLNLTLTLALMVIPAEILVLFSGDAPDLQNTRYIT